jgi:hypothetical protein
MFYPVTAQFLSNAVPVFKVLNANVCEPDPRIGRDIVILVLATIETISVLCRIVPLPSVVSGKGEPPIVDATWNVSVVLFTM